MTHVSAPIFAPCKQKVGKTDGESKRTHQIKALSTFQGIKFAFSGTPGIDMQYNQPLNASSERYTCFIGLIHGSYNAPCNCQVDKRGNATYILVGRIFCKLKEYFASWKNILQVEKIFCKLREYFANWENILQVEKIFYKLRECFASWENIHVLLPVPAPV